ncbi:secreted protein containing DUF1592 [Rhodopirellula maiorica SM1]|uniref:Secreted protein containing DUF1592 n=1 Tax=Rhodopirellula maiorica SM1 TaxID=1265738 RepID=M5RME5_9BACT|nr:DUF1592 domain-containing protein [Rhodopirellula maiorica]EMI20356.1 secreted protein containing DUF1592 [Rhodopirellula maiorica SM1]
MLVLLTVGLAVGVANAAPPVNALATQISSTSETQLAAFFERHCVECHSGSEAEAGIRIDDLTASSPTPTDLPAWSRVVDAIEHGEMPPPDSPRPDSAESSAAVQQIIDQLARFSSEKPRSLRRLNRREYENTIHDLLGIDVPLMDLLPEDQSVQGFDNVADGLSISSVLLERYLQAADVAFDAVIRRIKPLPAETRHVQLMQVRENIESVKKKKGGTIEVENSFVKFTPGWPPARLDAVHPIEDGVYRCRVAVWPHDPGDRTLSVAIYTGSLFGPETRKFIGIFDVTGTPQTPRVIEFTTAMDEGHSIHIVPRIWPEHVTWRDKHESRPGVGIAWAETHGPLDQSFPSEAQKQLFGNLDSITMVPEQSIYMRHRKGVQRHVVESSQPADDAERIIRNLVPRAFRRRVDESEIEPFVRLTLDRLQSGRTFEQAVRAGVTAVLCSPQFLLVNRDPQVDSYTIASRMSYFLWSTMPDERLLELAASDKLRDPKIRMAEAERMMRDPKIERFVENFTGQWLDLRDIDFTTPDGKLYPEYDPLLIEAMLGETRHFFAHILREDLSVANFIDSDFTFLNERIAKHYGIPGIRGNETFQRVELPAASVRGGVLTHASVLKVTANGTTTSPVLRGNWVLTNLLGRTVPPPPPGVAAVEPDIRGATTIREQLSKHVSIGSCASCHKRIDPAGFALEHFDPIGGERTWYRSLGEGEKIPEKRISYRKGPTVETASQFADGRSFDDFQQFRECLLQDKTSITRAITSKLCVYALGRRITLSDRRAIDSIVNQASPRGHGLRSLIQGIVASDLFLQP